MPPRRSEPKHQKRLEEPQFRTGKRFLALRWDRTSAPPWGVVHEEGPRYVQQGMVWIEKARPLWAVYELVAKRQLSADCCQLRFRSLDHTAETRILQEDDQPPQGIANVMLRFQDGPCKAQRAAAGGGGAK